MTDHPFLQFIELVNFDQKIQSVENQKIAIENEISAVKKQEDEYVRDINDLDKRIFHLKKLVDEQELEMKILDQKEKDKKKHFENLADYKDYQALKIEVDTIHRLQLDQEKKVLDAWNQLENVELSLQKKTKENAEQLHELHTRIKDLGHTYMQLDDECATMLNQRAKMEEKVPAEWLEKYSLMRARVADPVVEILHQSCGACSQMVTMQDMVRARRGALLQCQKCYRLLYAPEIMQQVQ